MRTPYPDAGEQIEIILALPAGRLLLIALSLALGALWVLAAHAREAARQDRYRRALAAGDADEISRLHRAPRG